MRRFVFGAVGAFSVLSSHCLLIEYCVWVVGRSDSQALNGLPVPLSVAAFGLGDGGLQRIETEGHRAARNEEQAIKAGSAWQGSVCGRHKGANQH